MITFIAAAHVKPPCAGRWDLFFTPEHEDTSRRIRRERKARRICAACPLAAACLTWAVEHGEEGFWGGRSEDDRLAEHRREIDRKRRRRERQGRVAA